MLENPRLGSVGLGLVLCVVACSAEVRPPASSSSVRAGSTALPSAGQAAAYGGAAAPSATAGVLGVAGRATGPAVAGISGGAAGQPGGGGPGTAGRGGTLPPGAAGASSPAGRSGGSAGSSTPTGTAGATAPAAGSGASGDDPFAAERQACVDHINMYRATLMLAPLKRATPEQEKCSDDGAKADGDSGQAHGSAGSCRGLGGQNTCPGYPVRSGGTLTSTLTGCLDQMWAEGEPPNGVQACIADRTGCFLEHGHWINMSQASYGTVACGFYKMTNGRYWMNQNFGR